MNDNLNDNPYYEPEKCGLELLYSFDPLDDPWEFDIYCLWQVTAPALLPGSQAGDVLAGRDSGCSCPTPFEDFKGYGDFTMISHIRSATAFLDGSNASAGQRLDWQTKARAALEQRDGLRSLTAELSAFREE